MSTFNPFGKPGSRRTRAVLVAMAVTTVAPLATQATAQAAGAKPAAHRPTFQHHNTKLMKQLRGAHASPAILGKSAARGEPGRFVASEFPSRGPVSVMIQLAARPAARSFAAARVNGSKAAAARAGRSQAAAVDSLARQVQSHFSASATRAHTLFTAHNVYAGIAVHTTAGRLPALSRLAGVQAIRPLPTAHLANSSSVNLIGAPQVWQGDPGNTGENVKIGVIDTGVDYTHANFGGTGNKAAYVADHAVADEATLNVPSGDYPSDKVVGGVDLAGDNYDPESSDPALYTPQEDPNPLDCEGHGSHVSGSATGLGVLTDGSTYVPGDNGPTLTDLGNLAPADYASLFRVGPGVAPGADLYGIRVFGCDGSTNLVVEALDWAADPDQNGNFNDHLDVVNMSLGADYAPADSPDVDASNNASLLGITVVAAAGNAGDSPSVAGSPGNASRAIGVAASQDANTILDALQENAPDTQKIAGQRSAAFDWANNGPVTGNVVAVDPTFSPGDDMSANNADGCSDFTPEQAAAVAGNIAWLEWTDDDAVRACGSAGRSAKAVAAGAIGVVLADDEDIFAAGITGSDVVPVFMIRKTDADALRPYAEDPEGNGPLNVTLTDDLRNSVSIDDPSHTDQIADFSSRGWGDATTIKPDVTAPGVSIFSTAMGTGDEGATNSGTSMATPHTAGVAALVKAAHHTWYPEQIKAAIMDTANHHVFATDSNNRNYFQDREAPVRVGAGRVDAFGAATTGVLAYSKNTQGSVGVSFGTVAVTDPQTSVNRLVTVENTTDFDQSYGLSYHKANAGQLGSSNGVTYTFPDTVDVPAHSSRTVTVTLNVDREQLQRRIDSTREQFPAATGGLENQFVTEASGWLEFQPNNVFRGKDSNFYGQLRLPVYSAPRPASDMHAATGGDSETLPLEFGGAQVTPGVDTGTLTDSGTGVQIYNGQDFPDVYESIISGYELGASSPEKPACAAEDSDFSQCTPVPSDKASDIQYAGAASDASLIKAYDAGYYDGGTPPAPEDQFDPSDGLTYFAVSTYGAWRNPVGAYEFDVLIDNNGDGDPDLVLFNTRATGTDVFITELIDLASGDLLDLELLNNTDGSVDTNMFDNNVMVLPVYTAALLPQSEPAGAPTVDPAAGQISYQVASFSLESGLSDLTDPAGFNVLDPGLTIADGQVLNPWDEELFFYYEQFWLDAPANQCASKMNQVCTVADTAGSQELQVWRSKAQYAADGAQGLLLLHHHNLQATTAEVVPTALDSTVTTLDAVQKNPAPYGFKNKAMVTVTTDNGTPAGSVDIVDGTTTIATGDLDSDGHAIVKLPVLKVGSHDLHAEYTGDGVNAPSSSLDDEGSPLTLVVTKAATSTTLTINQKREIDVDDYLPFRAVTRVLLPGAAQVTGKVTFYDNGAKMGTVATDGVATFRMTKLPTKGHHTFTAVYHGNRHLKTSTGEKSVQVKPLHNGRS